ncbi:MAG: nucleotidyltransferase family protein [Rhodothalassiaceae bacterium]
MADSVRTTAYHDVRLRLDAPVPANAMVLAAGLGTRMAPLTETRPKALVEVAGRSLIDRALDRLGRAGVTRAVVNLHHHADMLEAHLQARSGPPALTFSDERARLLDTGGGVKAALPLLGDAAFFVVNCDALWLDGLNDTLKLMASAWDETRMDVLLLIVLAVNAVAYFGTGDFVMDGLGRLARKPERVISPYVYGGVAIVSPKAMQDAPDAPEAPDAPDAPVFSMNKIFDACAHKQRLYGMIHEGQWAHVGTPEAVRTAERRLFS